MKTIEHTKINEALEKMDLKGNALEKSAQRVGERLFKGGSK